MSTRTIKPKQKTCKICKERFEPKSPMQLVCDWKCAYEYSKIHLNRESKKLQEKHNKELNDKVKKFKENLKDYEAEARKYFQKWVRLRDKNEPCVSCGRTNTDRWDGGHYFKAELYSGLIFHEDNCHKQCSRPCNKDLDGNLANYRINLIKKIGEEKVKWLEDNKDSLRQKKYTRDELLRITTVYKIKIVELEKLNK